MIPIEKPPIIVEVQNPPSVTHITFDIPTTISGDMTITNLEGLNNLSINIAQLQTQLETINTTLSGIPDGSYPVALVGSLSSVIAAFIFNVLYWWRVDERKKLNSVVDEYLVALDSFEKVATVYWLYPYQKRHRKKNAIQEMRIVSSAKLLRQCGAKIVDNIPHNYFFLPNNKLKNSTDDELKLFASTIFDIATGGDFGSPKRDEDLKKVNRIIQHCTRTKMFLSGLSN
ncbi:hypothetical protein [Photobacterium sp. OFAV2-7]|uniref:hypothetical protein n=1 Tax=Photobacterium sp. OFAV2-7 TaxID=2917748 RepID=UPI001EF529E2|nr:hypothetical protein [Photobacterium sp. OFAV2-7]MCG7586493.1 hypothetical protein [Photobacterium sp. OFAV2-7]